MLGRLDLSAGVRHDAAEDYDGFTSWRVGGVLAVPEIASRIRASAGTAFKAPSLFQRFGVIGGFFRGNPDFEVLHSVPPERITGVQLNDGPAEHVGEIRDETRHRRQLPGSGDFDLDRVVRELEALGVSAPWAIEVMSDDLATKDLRTACRIALDSVSSLLAKSRRRQ